MHTYFSTLECQKKTQRVSGACCPHIIIIFSANAKARTYEFILSHDNEVLAVIHDSCWFHCISSAKICIL